MWNFFLNHWRDGIEILFLATCIYQIYRAFRATRGAQILVGLGTILVVLTLVSSAFKFEVIQWIIARTTTFLAFALIVIFQPELRTGLARLGSNRLFSFYSRRRHDFLERFADAVVNLSRKRTGALFAIQRDVSLKEQLDTGVLLDARFSQSCRFHPVGGEGLHAICQRVYQTDTSKVYLLRLLSDYEGSYFQNLVPEPRTGIR